MSLPSVSPVRSQSPDPTSGTAPTTGQETPLTIDVIGLPAPQGSKRAFVVNGHAVMAESSKKVKPWRQDVKAAAREATLYVGWRAFLGPVELAITFYMPRPKAHYRTGKHAGDLKPTAPSYVDKIPDLSKLVRATEDALTEARVWRDDSQVARLVVEKRYADAATGARITIRPLVDDPTVSVSVSNRISLPVPETDTDQAPGAAAEGEAAQRRDTTTSEGALW